MAQSDKNPSFPPEKLAETLQELTGLELSLAGSIRLFRWLGYGLLLLALLNLIDTLVPLRLMNPAWEFQTLGSLVDAAPVSLFGLVLVFFGERNWRQRWERRLLQVLSWLVLLAGIGFLLLAPLGIVNTWRLDNNTNVQLEKELGGALAQIEQVRGRLEQVKTRAEMDQLLSRIQGLPPTIREAQQLGQVKGNLSNFLVANETRLKQEAKIARSQRRLQLLKQSVKWNLGAAIVGVLFIGIWRWTEWARLN